MPEEDYEAEPLPGDRQIKVYAEYKYIGMHLKHPRFTMVDIPEEADVIWMTTHFKNFR